jgi:hypothetical protein
MSALCQKRTFAAQQIAASFDHLVGARNSNDVGISMSMVFAVFRCVARSTGRSAGFLPLEGAQPADLPIEQLEFELVVNLTPPDGRATAAN